MDSRTEPSPVTPSLLVRNLLFTIVVPGAGGAYAPWLILARHGALPAVAAWYALPLIAVGVTLYVACVRVFATVGRGTPGLWDAPRRFVAAGPYLWVRNPIYIAAVLIVSGEAWLFGSPSLLLYAAGLAVACHLLVVGYEEPRLANRFGEPYRAYRRTVPRWIPRRPPASQPPASQPAGRQPASQPAGRQPAARSLGPHPPRACAAASPAAPALRLSTTWPPGPERPPVRPGG